MAQFQTGCARAWSISDKELERAVICGILHCPDRMFALLPDLTFTTAAYHWPIHIIAHEELHEMWVNFKRINHVSFFLKIKQIGKFNEFGGREEFAQWLVDTWNVRHWWYDLDEWWPRGMDIPDCGGKEQLTTCIGIAAAKNVLWLAARRRAIHEANETIRDATKGNRGPEDQYPLDGE